MVKQHNIILDVFILHSYTKRVFTEFDWSTVMIVGFSMINIG